MISVGSLETILFRPSCVQWASLIPITAKLSLFISSATLLVLLVSHIVRIFHELILIITLIVRKGHHRPRDFLAFTMRRHKTLLSEDSSFPN